MTTSTSNSERKWKSVKSRIGRELVSSMVLQLVRDGTLQLEGKSVAELQDEATKIIERAIAKDGSNLVIHIDHTSDLLREARSCVRTEQIGLSAFYFATFFEHRLNWMIVQICQQKRLHENQIKQILREANFRSKCSWLLAILDCKPPLSNRAIKTINEITELRNAFIHYKWPSKNFDASNQEIKRFTLLMNDAEYVVRHLKNLEDKWIYKGNRKIARDVATFKTEIKANRI